MMDAIFFANIRSSVIEDNKEYIEEEEREQISWR